MLGRWLITMAYALQQSRRYRRLKTFFYNLLENPDSRLKTYFDFCMIALILASVSLLVYESRRAADPLIATFDNLVLVIFILEYLLRAWLFNDNHELIIKEYEKTQYLGCPFQVRKVLWEILRQKFKFASAPFAIIDVLAIIPSYRPIRLLRFFLLFRLFKLFRYSSSIKIFTDVLVSKRFELSTLLMFMGLVVVIATLAIYFFESPAQGGKIENLYTGFYWAIVTISTVGYGDISPHTVGGRLVAITLILSGLAVIAFFTSIIVSAFEDKLLILRDNKTYAELESYRSFAIICGFGRVGQEVAKQLHNDKHKFIILDKGDAQVALARQAGFLAIQNDASNNAVLLNAGINRGATEILCCTGDDIANVYITLTSRYLNPTIKIISRVNRIDNEKKLYQAGADNVIRPFEIAGLLAAEYIGQPVAFEAILGMLQDRQHLRLETILIQSGSALENCTIAELALERYKLKLLGVISRNIVHKKHPDGYQVKDQQFYFNPKGHFKVRAQDSLLVLGREYSIEYFQAQLRKKSVLSLFWG